MSAAPRVRPAVLSVRAAPVLAGWAQPLARGPGARRPWLRAGRSVGRPRRAGGGLAASTLLVSGGGGVGIVGARAVHPTTTGDRCVAGRRRRGAADHPARVPDSSWVHRAAPPTPSPPLSPPRPPASALAPAFIAATCGAAERSAAAFFAPEHRRNARLRAKVLVEVLLAVLQLELEYFISS